jgi:hypothetical protein
VAGGKPIIATVRWTIVAVRSVGLEMLWAIVLARWRRAIAVRLLTTMCKARIGK